MTPREDNHSEERGQGLKHISEILGGQMSEMSKNPPRQTRQEECECKTCGQKFPGEVTVYNYFRPPREIRSNECPKCKQSREEEDKRLEEQELELRRIALRETWKKVCGTPWGLQCTRFEDFEPDYQRKPLKLCREFAENFNVENPRGMPSLLLYSAVPGVGKTTLMACITNHIIDSWYGDPNNTTCPIRFESGPGLVKRIRATYNIPATDTYHEREEEVYAQLRGVKLLMLDDVGKEQPHSYRFTQEVYWYIIDERVKAGLPVIVSSRLEMRGPGSLEELMTVDAVDRLYGMCRGQRVILGGTSYRRLHKIP